MSNILLYAAIGAVTAVVVRLLLLVLRPNAGKRAQRQEDELQPAERQLACSGCFGSYPRAGLRALPSWNEKVANFNSTYRCGRCWPKAVAETRAFVSADMPADTKAKMQDFLRHHDHHDLAGTLTTPAETRAHLLEFLDRLERRDTTLHP